MELYNNFFSKGSNNQIRLRIKMFFVNFTSDNMAKLKLDLHDIYNKGYLIDKALNDIIEEALEKKIKLVEIIPGKGSGQLKKKVIRFLQQKHIKQKYHRIDKDSKNFGRLFIHFRF